MTRHRVFDQFPHNTKWQIKVVDGKYIVYSEDTQESHTFNGHTDAIKFIYDDVRATYPWKFQR